MVFSIFFVHYQWTYFKSLHTKALMIYDVYNGYLIDIKIGENWHTFKSHTISDKSERFATENYRIKNNMYIEHQKITYDSICMVHIGDKTHMLRPPKIDLIGFCNPIGVVYLDDNYSIKDTLPLLNLSPQMIVLDQSISRKNTYQWKKICHKMGIVCHAIQFDGPLEIPIN